MTDPNRAFRERRTRGLKRGHALLTIQCGHCLTKKVVSQDLWCSDGTLVCSFCGRTQEWNIIHKLSLTNSYGEAVLCHKSTY